MIWESITLNPAQAQAVFDTLEELSGYAGLSERQQALLGDLRRASGQVTTIRATLGSGRVTHLPVRVGVFATEART